MIYEAKWYNLLDPPHYRKELLYEGGIIFLNIYCVQLIEKNDILSFIHTEKYKVKIFSECQGFNGNTFNNVTLLISSESKFDVGRC